MTVSVDLVVLVAASTVIYFTGGFFASASSNIGDYLKLPRSVKGATFDAVSSSLPELMIALFSVISFKRFEVGIGTIAGSALFNLLIIPGICVLVAPAAFKVSKEVVSRDGMFYNISVFALLAALLYSKMWGFIVPIAFILIYVWYLKDIFAHVREFRTVVQKRKLEINIWKEIGIALVGLALIAGASYFMTEHSISLADALGIPAIIIAFTIVAAATSFPDTIISVINAKKGNTDDAAANVFGSNIFDICIGLGLPLLIAVFMGGPVKIVFDNLEIVVGLLGATILVLYYLAQSHTLSKRHAWTLLGMYFVFLAYVVFLGINGA